jgi:hypothetical protein
MAEARDRVWIVIADESVDSIYVFESETDANEFANQYDCEEREEPNVIVAEMPIFSHGSPATQKMIAAAASGSSADTNEVLQDAQLALDPENQEVQ